MNELKKIKDWSKCIICERPTAVFKNCCFVCSRPFCPSHILVLETENTTIAMCNECWVEKMAMIKSTFGVLSQISPEIDENEKRVIINYIDEEEMIMIDKTWLKGYMKHRENGPAKVTYYVSGAKHVESWCIDGENHRGGDEPAVINRYENQEIYHKDWYKDGKRHREKDNPARIEFHKDGHRAKLEAWWLKGKHHRWGGKAAVIRYNELGHEIEEEWWVEGQQTKWAMYEGVYLGGLHRENDGCGQALAAKVWYHDNGKERKRHYYKKGKFDRHDGPAIELFYDNGMKEKECWYNKDKKHREDGPARIEYREDGSKILEEWWVDDEKQKVRECLGENVEHWYENGLLIRTKYTSSNNNIHRDDGPAQSWYNEKGYLVNQEWRIDGYLNGVNGFPAIVDYYEDGVMKWKERWCVNSQLHRTSCLPAEVHYDRNNKVIFKGWYDHDTLIEQVCIQYYENGNKKIDRWDQHGLLHRENGPAVIKYWEDGTTKKEKWYKRGKLHRIDFPAKIEYYKNGEVTMKSWYIDSKLIKSVCYEDHKVEKWFKKGKLSREDGPAVIEYWEESDNKRNEQWYKDGEKHREEDDDKPAYIEYNDVELLGFTSIIRKEFWVHGQQHRVKNPAVITYKGDLVCVTYHEWWVKDFKTKVAWYLGDLAHTKHRDGAPAKIRYHDNGEESERCYYKNGKLDRQNGPAIEQFYKGGRKKEERWCRDYKLHREGAPAVIRYDEKTGARANLEWWSKGKQESISYQKLEGTEVSIVYYDVQKKQLHSKAWYNKDYKLHREYGNAYVEWWKTGNVKLTKRCWNGVLYNSSDGKWEEDEKDKWVKEVGYLPAMIEYDESGVVRKKTWVYSNGKVFSERWYKNGKLHRDDGPAYNEWRENGKKKVEAWFTKGVAYRGKTTTEFDLRQVAIIEYDANEMVRKKTFCYKSGIIYLERWYKNGKDYRADGGPTQTWYWENGNKQREDWPADGDRYQNGEEPAKIYYNQNGQKQREKFFDKTGSHKKSRWYKDGKFENDEFFSRVKKGKDEIVIDEEEKEEIVTIIIKKKNDDKKEKDLLHDDESLFKNNKLESLHFTDEKIPTLIKKENEELLPPVLVKCKFLLLRGDNEIGTTSKTFIVDGEWWGQNSTIFDALDEYEFVTHMLSEFEEEPQMDFPNTITRVYLK